MYNAQIFIRHKKGILDPQGKTIKNSLHALKFSGVSEVKVGKLIDLKLEAKSFDDAKAKVNEMCKTLLANLVIEDFTFEIKEI